VAYSTCLFFKENSYSANAPPHFLAYLRREYPMLFHAGWQREGLRQVRAVYGREKVLEGKAGFGSLVGPQRVGGASYQSGEHTG
jgi:hypothetical protein